MNKICVIIPMYGKGEYTDKCVDMTIKNAGVGCDILVVDDGSLNEYKNDNVNVLRLNENSGFTAATNAGILWGQKRDYDYVLLLNNDTEPEPDFVKELLYAIEEDENIGIAASVRLHPNRPQQPVELCGSDLIRGFQYFTDVLALPEKPFDCNWIPLCSGLMRMDMIREIGILDKRFRNHCSDSSYCLWAKINHWRVMTVPKSRVIHHLSVTTTENNIVVNDDQKKFLEKLAGLDYAQIMVHMPLDGEAKTWGKLDFSVYTK